MKRIINSVLDDHLTKPSIKSPKTHTNLIIGAVKHSQTLLQNTHWARIKGVRQVQQR